MFNLFKPKMRFKSPYTLPNNEKEYYGRNILDLKIKLEQILDNSDNIYSVQFMKQKIISHEYFTNFSGQLIENIEDTLKDIYTMIHTLEKRNNIDKYNINTIDRNSRILSVTENIKRTLNYLIDD